MAMQLAKALATRACGPDACSIVTARKCCQCKTQFGMFNWPKQCDSCSQSFCAKHLVYVKLKLNAESVKSVNPMLCKECSRAERRHRQTGASHNSIIAHAIDKVPNLILHSAQCATHNAQQSVFFRTQYTKIRILMWCRSCKRASTTSWPRVAERGFLTWKPSSAWPSLSAV
jgi:hypothetical protein